MARKGKSFWQGLGKIGAVTMLLAFTVVLFAQQGLANDQLIFHNTDTGKVMFWNLNSADKLKSGDMYPEPGFGWGLSDEWGTAKGWTIAATRQRTVSGIADNQLIWHNTDTGKLMYWNLGDSGLLKNRTQEDGWDLVSDWALNPNWKVVGLGGEVEGQAGNDYLQFWNQESNLVCYWVLNSDGELRSQEQGPAAADTENGWDVNNGYTEDDDGWMLPSGWYLAAIRGIGSSGRPNNQLIWHNTLHGKLMFWNLNTNNSLVNRTQGSTSDDGWDFIDDNEDPFDMSAWRVAGVTDHPSLTAHSYLQFFNPKTQDTQWWSLTLGGQLVNRTQGSGWDNNYTKKTEWKPAAGWYVAKVNAKTSNNQLIWQNSDTGRLMYWNMNTNNSLKNMTKNDGWGLTGEYKKDEEWTPNKAWRVRGLFSNL